MGRRPVISPLARPGRRYISGFIYLGLALTLAILVLSLRYLLG